MNQNQAIKLIRDTFENNFDKARFSEFIANLLKKVEPATFTYSGQYIPAAFSNNIAELERLGKYYDDNNNSLDVLIVRLKRGSSVDRARTLQRNFIAWYLNGSRGGNLKDAALVAFVAPDHSDWRFSLIKMQYRFEEGPNDKMKVKEEFTPARRWSFLVGANEKSHTAQSRFLPMLLDDSKNPSLEHLEQAFNIETVSDEFFVRYRSLFITLKKEIDKILENDKNVRNEFQQKNIDTVGFAKKLLGQIVFIYFLQKKGWFGVPRKGKWGEGSKNFLRELFEKKYCNYRNFFNDILEPLFYEALRTDRLDSDHYYSRFDCKIPFLNGGLFDPIDNYDWVNTDITLTNELFSNNYKTPEGDIGDGILDIFDRYNFTVNEEEPLDKEVAIDPELLGKTYERFNAIRKDNFDEFVKSLGKKEEETKFNKEYGVYYTPRQIVHYMCQESLIEYLHTETNIPKQDIEIFIKHGSSIKEHEEIAKEKEENIASGKQKETTYEYKMPESVRKNAEQIDNLLADITICDPAVGSGAFPVGLMYEVVQARLALNAYLGNGEQRTSYEFKRHFIEKSLYAVDIDPGAVEVAKLRLWLSLVVDEEDFYTIKPLPNLDYKIMCGDSLTHIEINLFNQESFAKLEELKPKYLNESNPGKKHSLKQEIDKLLSEVTSGHKEFDIKVYFSEVFQHSQKKSDFDKGGFDIVIGNPPYISTKGIDAENKKQLEKNFGFADDAYNHFFFKAIQLLKENGILTFITSKTYWTIQTKKNLRELLLKNTILQIFDTANPFENAMVDTAVAIVKKIPPQPSHEVVFLDGKTSIIEPKKYTIQQSDYANAPNKVIFIPTDFNKKIYQKLSKKVSELLNQWWNKISTSKNIEKHKRELVNYRKSLKPGDITLLGLITEGGQGLATANNGKYIGVLEGTKWADNVLKQRPEKLLLATQFCKTKNIKNKADAQAFLDNLSEKEIRQLFDDLKEQYGRDIFGQGWLYRIVSPNEIADVNNLTDEEKLNGIRDEKTFVPYDKGDKDGNRWYAPTPYYIDWSKENVEILQTDPRARWQGYQFYFREGFCWSDIHTVLLKCRTKTNGIHDVKSMSLFSLMKDIPDWYFVCLINSTFISEYDFNFVNNTQTFQINDARQLPIIIPTPEQLKEFEEIFNRAVQVQKQKFAGKLSEQEAEAKLDEIQKQLDERVLEMYGLK